MCFEDGEGARRGLLMADQGLSECSRRKLDPSSGFASCRNPSFLIIRHQMRVRSSLAHEAGLDLALHSDQFSGGKFSCCQKQGTVSKGLLLSSRSPADDCMSWIFLPRCYFTQFYSFSKMIIPLTKADTPFITCFKYIFRDILHR